MDIQILIENVENILNDIVLSGFHTTQNSTIERIKENINLSNGLGMKKLSELLENLENELNKRKNSFEYEIIFLTDIFCKIEFYLESLKSYN